MSKKKTKVYVRFYASRIKHGLMTIDEVPAKYKEAVEEMISRTSTNSSPWYIVPANDKYYARIFVLKKIIKEIEKCLYGV